MVRTATGGWCELTSTSVAATGVIVRGVMSSADGDAVASAARAARGVEEPTATKRWESGTAAALALVARESATGVSASGVKSSAAGAAVASAAGAARGVEKPIMKLLGLVGPFQRF